MIIDEDKLPRPKLADQVQGRLLDLIRGGGLQPGDGLPSERELAQSLAVGRVVIREALQDLQRKGLVEIRHGGRPRVAKPTLDRVIQDMGETMRHMLTHSGETFAHFKTARLVFEKEMVRTATRARSPEGLVRLRQIIDLMDHAKVEREQQREQREDGGGSTIEIDAFLRFDGEFHKAIAAMSGNPVLAALSGALFDWLTHFHIDRIRSPGLERLTIQEHALIVEAIEAGDPDLAVGRMAEHLNRANQMYQQEHQTSS